MLKKWPSKNTRDDTGILTEMDTKSHFVSDKALTTYALGFVLHDKHYPASRDERDDKQSKHLL